MQTIFTVPDMACGACADKISHAIRSIDPQAQIVADPQTKLVRIESELTEIALHGAIVDTGYTVGK